jgi:hypothetical protein
MVGRREGGREGEREVGERERERERFCSFLMGEATTPTQGSSTLVTYLTSKGPTS